VFRAAGSGESRLRGRGRRARRGGGGSPLPPPGRARPWRARRGARAAGGSGGGPHRSAPQDLRWIVPLAGLAIASGDTARADSLLATLRTPDARALLLSGLIATARDEPARARPLLVRALAAGGDTTPALPAPAVPH